VSTIILTCPGSREDAVQLTNEFTTQFGVGHPRNTGDCPLFLDALDGGGNSVQQLQLTPGDGVDWFSAPQEAVAIFAVCHQDCSGTGQLTFDTPSA
jgi:hypothetical protein